jgi:hypothetical protein
MPLESGDEVPSLMFGTTRKHCADHAFSLSPDGVKKLIPPLWCLLIPARLLSNGYLSGRGLLADVRRQALADLKRRRSKVLLICT